MNDVQDYLTREIRVMITVTYSKFINCIGQNFIGLTSHLKEHKDST